MHQWTDRDQGGEGAALLDGTGDPDPRAGAVSVTIGIGGHRQVDDAPCGAPDHAGHEQHHEPLNRP